MSVFVIEPHLTPESLVTIFEKLCNYEIKKRINANPGVEHYEGLQTGYVSCLIDMFGEASDDSINRTFDAKQSWIHFINNMVETHLTGVIDEMEEMEEIGLDEFETIDIEVKSAAKLYVLNHLNEAKTAISNL